MRAINRPLGPGGTWKTGQRVPESGNWQDQYGQVSWFNKYGTFICCIGRDEGAFRTLIRAAAEDTA